MLFVQVISKNLLRRKMRSILTVLGLAVAVGSTTSLLSIAWSFADSEARYYLGRGVDIVVVRAGVAERITSSLRVSLAPRLLDVPGVGEVDYKLTEMVSLGEGSLIGVPLYGLEPGGFGLNHLAVSAGRTLATNDQGCVLLGEALADSIGASAGREIQLEGKVFQVIGVFRGADAFESNTIVASLADVQKLMERPGQVSEFQVRADPVVANESDLQQLCRRIESLCDDEQRSLGLQALVTRQFVRTDMETRLAHAMAWGTSVVAIILSVLGMSNTMLMAVLERTKELGVLRAIGWSRRRVTRLILGEAIVLSSVGAVVGILGTGILIRFLSSWPATRTIVRPELSTSAVVCGIAIAMVAGVAGSLYPAYRGASIPVVEALRYE